MTAQDESSFRLRIARQLLHKAQEAMLRKDWREAALFARGAVEAAAKAVIACVASVPRSHEPAQILREALAAPGFPPSLRETAQTVLPVWRGYGMQEHVLLSYGDEQNRIDPWSLVTEERARQALGVATTGVDFASRCRAALFGDLE